MGIVKLKWCTIISQFTQVVVGLQTNTGTYRHVITVIIVGSPFRLIGADVLCR